MSLLSMRCPVCENETFLPGIETFDDRYGEPNRYQLARCNICDHLATAPRLLESDLPSLYGTYYPRKNISPDQVMHEAAKSKHTFARIARWWNGSDNQGQYSVRKGEAMLDVGCGSGTSLLEAKILGANPFGIEADPNVKSIAVALDLNIHFGNLQDHPFPGQSFDLIVMNQVIEHLPDPDLALQALRDRLSQNGRIVLVFPNINSLWRQLSGNRWINWHIPYHLHHFNSSSFNRMLQHCDLEVTHSRTITPNLWTLLQIRAKLTKPKLGLPSPIWTVANQSIAQPKTGSIFKPLRAILRISLLTMIAAINRIVDTFGMGDSLLIELRIRK